MKQAFKCSKCGSIDFEERMINLHMDAVNYEVVCFQCYNNYAYAQNLESFRIRNEYEANLEFMNWVLKDKKE